jgi:hypothetical protein
VNTLAYPQGGHLWVFLNWALGFRDAGLDVVWLDMLEAGYDPAAIPARLRALRERIAPWGFGDRIALVDHEGRNPEVVEGCCLSADEAASCDMLFDLRYNLPRSFVGRFPKSALLDIDPGLLQYALRGGAYDLAPHDRYFSIGRNLDQPFIASGHPWITVGPCVHVDSWKPQPVAPEAAFTTIGHWIGTYMLDADGTVYANDKRAAFEGYLDLPTRIPAPMELGLMLDKWEMVDERARLQRLGWRVADAHTVAGTPTDFQRYVQGSLAEFSCAKPSCIRLRNGWISDRTLCYLAAGRPAVVQWTGDFPGVSGEAGLLRFHTPEEAERCLRQVIDRWDFHSAQARQLAEEVFSANRVVPLVLNAL